MNQHAVGGEKRRTHPAWLLVPILIMLGLLVLWIRALSDPVPMDRLHRLRKGMTQDEVRSILGRPTEEGRWVYYRPLVFGWVEIHWLSDGTYAEFNFERY